MLLRAILAFFARSCLAVKIGQRQGVGANMVVRNRQVAGFIAAALSAAVPAQAQSANGDLLFQAEAQQLSGVCTGKTVRLEGNHNHVKLSGPCTSLLVKGFANSLELTIAPGGAIRVEGSQNRVQYAVRGDAPSVLILGPDNEVTPIRSPGHAAAAPPVPAQTPASPLALSGDDEERLADCAGGDVLVTGHRSAYVIRGSCRSLVVRGDLLTVQVVMQPGAHITVAGLGSIVSWAVQGHGHPPAGIVHGAGSRIQRAESIGGQLVK